MLPQCRAGDIVRQLIRSIPTKEAPKLRLSLNYSKRSDPTVEAGSQDMGYSKGGHGPQASSPTVPIKANQELITDIVSKAICFQPLSEVNTPIHRVYHRFNQP